MRHISKWLAAALLALPLLMVAGVDEAVAGSTLTGTIRGAVIDENGDPLPGVTMIMRSDALIREQAAITDADGNFFVPGLAPGEYTVVAQLQGFQTIQQTTQVLLDKTTTLTFTLVAGELTETVTVVATRPVVDKTATETTVNLTKDFTEQLPTLRSYQSLLQFAPGVSGGSNPNMLGGTSNSNTYQLDGVSITDPVTGTFGQNINYDIIEAVDIKLTGVSAEYGGFQGGLSNVITKSGGNDFTGSIRDEIDSPSWEKGYNTKSLDEYQIEQTHEQRFASDPACYPEGLIDESIDPNRGLDANAGPNCWVYLRPDARAQGDRGLSHDIQGTFGGPVVRDSAWFFLSYNRNDTVGIRSLINPTGGPFSDGTYIRNFQGDNSSGKLSWQIVNNHKVQYTYGEDPADVPRCYAGLFWGGGCYDGFNVDQQAQGGFFWTGNWNAVWGNRVLTDAKITHWENGFLIDNFEPRPPEAFNEDLIITTPGGLGAGPEAGYPLTVDLSSGVGFDNTVFSDDPETRERDQYEAKATVFFDTGSLGSHTLKVGVDYQEQTQVGSSVLSGNAIAYMQGWINPPAGLGGTGDPYDINNRIYRAFWEFAPPGTSGSVTKNTALYIQDDWQLNEKWAFNIGVRFEDIQNENDVGSPIFDQTGFSPRLGASYDVTGEGKHVVKATASRYLDAIELTALGFFEQATGGQSAWDYYLNWNLFDGDGTNDLDDPNWVLWSSQRTDPSINTFSDSLEPQSIDELTLAYEFSITPTFGVMVKGVTREWNDIVGRTFSADYSSGSFVQALFLENKSEIERSYDAVILQAEKRFSNNWQMLANYTFQKAEGHEGSTGGDEQGFTDYGAWAGVPQLVVNRLGELPQSVNTANITGSYRIPLPSKRHSLTVGGWLRFREGNRYSATDTLNVVVDGGELDADGDGNLLDVPLGTLGTELSGIWADPDEIPDSGDEYEMQANEVDQTADVTTYDAERGAFQAPNWWRLDLSLLWNFSFSKKVNFETRFEIYNVTDEQSPIAVNTSYEIDPQTSGENRTNHRFGYPLSYDDFQAARNYRVNFAIIW